ncbi:hypothetical protein GCM10008986_16500 [Salinibacillus aidingensis]|uniref:NUMOD4 domain-containing protein n=1 Tax=Salinibacillus aidingensis TaxID=237684 RepID=A0ABN1B761_9BACI
MIQLYDPKTNLITETTYDYLEKLTGLTRGSLQSARSRGRKIGTIDCYILKPDTTVQQRKEWYSKIKYPDEHWQEIDGSDGEFLISNYGRFKRVYKYTHKWLLPFLKKRRGYLMIKVKFKGKYQGYKISKLVAHHYLGDPKPGQVLRHKNGIKTDNFAGNLEYVSNCELGEKTGYLSKSKPVLQLDPETGKIIGEYRSAREAGRKTYMSYTAVLDVCNGMREATVDGFVFKFAEEYEAYLTENTK